MPPELQFTFEYQQPINPAPAIPVSVNAHKGDIGEVTDAILTVRNRYFTQTPKSTSDLQLPSLLHAFNSQICFMNTLYGRITQLKQQLHTN